MTAPFVIREQSFAEQIQPGINTLMQALQQRQQFKLQQQALELERQRTESQTQLQGAQRKEILDKLKQQEITLRAQDFATQSFMDAMVGDLDDPANINAIREQIIRKGDKDISSEALVHFDALLTERTERLTKAAQRRTEEVKANVLEGGQAAAIEAAQLAGQQAEAELAQTRQQTRTSATQQAAFELENQLRALEIDRDPVRVQKALDVWTSQAGITWKEARETAGLAPGGIADDMTFSPVAKLSDVQSERVQKALNFGTTMVNSDALMSTFIEQGARINFTTEIQKAARKGISGTLGAAINTIQSPEQQQMLHAGLNYVMAHRFFWSGQQSSDAEYLSMMRAWFEAAGDSEETIRQKRVTRQIQIQAIRDASQGLLDPVQVLEESIELMKQQGVSKERVALMERERALAIANQRRRANNPPIMLNTEPTTPDSLSASMQRIQQLLNSTVVVQ